MSERIFVIFTKKQTLPLSLVYLNMYILQNISLIVIQPKNTTINSRNYLAQKLQIFQEEYTTTNQPEYNCNRIHLLRISIIQTQHNDSFKKFLTKTYIYEIIIINIETYRYVCTCASSYLTFDGIVCHNIGMGRVSYLNVSANVWTECWTV